MKRVLTAVILIPLVILALFRAPLWLFTLLVLGVALLAAREYFDIAEKTGYRPNRFLGYIFLVVPFATIAGISQVVKTESGIALADVMAAFIGALPVFLLVIPLVFLAASLRADPLSKSLPDAAISYMLLPYVAFTLLVLPILRAGSYGALYLLFLMLLVWCGDIAAYYVGRAIGKHKLAPRISPGKTWEGAIASVVGAVIVGVLLFHYVNPIAHAFCSVHLLADGPVFYTPVLTPLTRRFPPAPGWVVTIFAVGVNAAAQVGDLVESALKRGCRTEGLGNTPARTRRRARPHRCASVRVARRALVLCIRDEQVFRAASSGIVAR